VLNAQADSDQTARLLANLFEYEDAGERQNTVAEIREMIGKDLESVTDAFADLILKKRREQLASLAEDEKFREEIPARPPSPTTTATTTASVTTGPVLQEADTKAVDEEFLRGPFKGLIPGATGTGTGTTGDEATDGSDIFTPKLPHPYLDPPKAVQGQLLRYWSKEEHEQHAHHEHDGVHDGRETSDQEFRCMDVLFMICI
jgi:hypothetical protein